MEAQSYSTLQKSEETTTCLLNNVLTTEEGILNL